MASAQSSKIPYPWTCDVWLVEDPSLLNNLFLYAKKKKKNTTPDTIVSRTVGSMCIQRLQRQLCPESIALFYFFIAASTLLVVNVLSTFIRDKEWLGPASG